MYAIAEGRATVGGTISRDQCRNWWDGRRETPCSDQARVYDTREQADAALADAPSSFGVVELDD